MDSYLDIERLDVFRVAVELDTVVADVCRNVPRVHAWLANQAQEASGSSVLNLAEALGREGADRNNRLRISRGSAMEARAAMLLLANRRVGAAQQHQQAAVLAVRLVQMLNRLGAHR